MGDIPILGRQAPSERERLRLLRGLSGAKPAEDEEEGLYLPPGYEKNQRPNQNKRSGRARKKKSKRRR